MEKNVYKKKLFSIYTVYYVYCIYIEAYFFRSCLDFTANKFKEILFCLFEVLFGIFALSVLANRPLFAANQEYKSTQKVFSTKL